METIDFLTQIAGRAEELTRRFRRDGLRVPIYPARQARADLEMVLRHTPLDLEGLAKADDSNFAHDLFGIRRHLDRSTGKLTYCFLPRYARVEARGK